MSAVINDGGPAFPCMAHGAGLGGASLRDYLAAKAMSGMLAAFKHWPRGGELHQVAELSYEAADEMLKARAA